MRRLESLLATFFLLLLASFLFLVGSVNAQVPPPYVSCEDTASPEFHSLRPYQKSPCNQEVEDTAQFCGNRLVLSDRVSEIQVTPPRIASNCTLISGGNYRCTYQTTKSATYEIDLSEASFPILGNTENVTNSQDSSDLTDAEKVNEYVSWYLNGVTGRAEYAPVGKDDISRLVDFSGPIKKLLPFEVQNELRANTVKEAVATRRGDADYRHNQVIGCTYGVSILGREIGGIPGPCYEDGLRSLLPHREHRLSEWNNHLPPKTSDFDNFQDYWKEYQEWRGKVCFEPEIPDFIPVIGGKKFLLCGENPFSPNYYSNLYSYIPFSSTEDRVGEVSVSSQTVSPASENLSISNVRLTTTPAELFFSHTEEAADLASILQLTFVPEGLSGTGGEVGVAVTEACDLKNIRTNEGDDLFAEKITGNLTYDAEFSCDFAANATSSACTKDISVGLGVVTKTPKADELWSRLVAGSSGIFKRIYPKIDANSGPIGCLLDIPGAAGVRYSGSGVTVSNPGERAGAPAELYFPHVGGIYEYFLKGIQTILRPKGFGEPITYGAPGDPVCQLALSSNICTEDCNSDPTNIDMAGVQEKFIDLANRWLGEGVGRPRTDRYNQVVNAARARGVDPIFTLAIWLHETGASNYQGICRALGGSNPNSDYCKWAQDFGVNNEAIYTRYTASGQVTADHFNDQLNAFVNLPGYYLSTCGADNAGCPMETFGAKYRDGGCTPSNASNGYVSGIKEIYNWLAPGQQFPCYPSRVSQ